jgi:hypothetical protein
VDWWRWIDGGTVRGQRAAFLFVKTLDIVGALLVIDLQTLKQGDILYRQIASLV